MIKVLIYDTLKTIIDGENCLNYILAVEHSKVWVTVLAIVKDIPMAIPTIYYGRNPPKIQMTARVAIISTVWSKSYTARLTSLVNSYPDW